MFLNSGNGLFTKASTSSQLTHISADGYPGEPRQPIIADLDNDGDQDIVITYVNDVHRVYRNRGDGTFDDVSQIAQLAGDESVAGAAITFDVNNDGLLDLYITYFGNYLKGTLPTLARRNVNGLANQLFINRGNFQFVNATESSGLGNTGWGQAAAHTDFTGDGLQDVIAGNDFGINAFYRNNGDSTFTDISDQIGTSKPSFTMGIGLSDLNGDLLPDVYISNIVTMNKDQKYVLPSADTPAVFNPDKLANMRVIEANDLFLSSMAEDQGLIRYQNSDAVQRGYAETGWSWGAEFFDADHDGDDDLYVLNGMNEFHIYSSEASYYSNLQVEGPLEAYMPVSPRERNVFFTNQDGRLNRNSRESGLEDLGNSRSLLTIDIDSDGDLDVVVNNYHGTAKVYRNNLPEAAKSSTKFQLKGDPAQGVNLDAIGAKLVVTLKSGVKLWREVRGAGGYMSMQSKTLHVGQPSSDIAQLDITWPNGKVQRLLGPFSDSKISIAYDP